MKLLTQDLSKLAIILRTYGFLGNVYSDEKLSKKIIISSHQESFMQFHLSTCTEPGKQLYYYKRKRYSFLNTPRLAYHALLPHITFTGDALEPVWVNDAGRAVIAWYRGQGKKVLLIGLDVEEEIIRHRQGDPAQVNLCKVKSAFGFEFERPLYLFQDQILPQYRTQPWADFLGFFLAEVLSRLSGYPLVEPLPLGARGAVILTGDDDCAYLEKYDEQLRLIGDFPITYLLFPQTNHTADTLAKFPSNVELGLHPDAVYHPDEYDRICTEQAKHIRELTGKPIRTLRNHSFLNRGYLGHLKAWEENGLALDVNYPGVDGNALNASFLPMRVRRSDGTWSEHYSLLTAFTDAMVFAYATNLTEEEASERIGRLVKQIESLYPGILVFNFHPQNIDKTRKLHQDVLGISRRRGWIALGLESYLNWLEKLESISINKLDGKFVLTSSQPVKDIVLRYPVVWGWRRKELDLGADLLRDLTKLKGLLIYVLFLGIKKVRDLIKKIIFKLPGFSKVKAKEEFLIQREVNLDQQEVNLAQRIINLSENEADLNQREVSLNQKEANLDQREVSLNQKEANLDQREVSLNQKEANLDQREVSLNQKEANLDQREVELELSGLDYKALIKKFEQSQQDNVDNTPWEHPYLTQKNISKFRQYSEDVWQFALDYLQNHTEPLKCAFVGRIAQNMHKWGKLAQKYGANAALFPQGWDVSALNSPEWEEFDGEFLDLMDGEGFLKANQNIPLEIPCYHTPLDGSQLYSAYVQFCLGNRTPLLHLIAEAPTLRHEVLLAYPNWYIYYSLAKELSKFDVIYATEILFPAYTSSKPYCAFSYGGDLQHFSGLSSDYGKTQTLSFNAAKFLMFTNPHTLGHCRRIGLTNGLYLPYPMDDSRYCPGEGQARKVWEEKYGKGVYILTTARLDSEVKGQDEKFFKALVDVAVQRPEVRFIFLAWGTNTVEFRTRIEAFGLRKQFIMLNPVGKKRLIDYYRSCDIVLDQFIYGYYGATGLEAASIGKPVIIKLRTEHYRPWYAGDVAPMSNASTLAEMSQTLLTLVDQPNLRQQKGVELRQWLVRNHGEEKTVPLLLALLRVTADRVPLPKDLVNPLWEELSDEEKIYHSHCMSKPST